jgi:rubredoxin
MQMDGSSENELPRMEYDVSLKCNVCGHRWEDKASMEATDRPMGIGYDWNLIHFCPSCGKVDNKIDGHAGYEM